MLLKGPCTAYHATAVAFLFFYLSGSDIISRLGNSTENAAKIAYRVICPRSATPSLCSIWCATRQTHCGQSLCLRDTHCRQILVRRAWKKP
ncbi:hypothetical protein BC940DRAFT_301723 [Gongronella butleri]|nr:hypothetical protein BC940DRAFT_301723 [Gongronella butleri]